MNAANVKGTLFWIPVLILSAAVLFVLVWLEVRPETSFQQLAEEGNVRELQEQIVRGADINALGRDGFSALACAVRGGQVDAMEVLLNAGADVSHPSAGGNTPLHRAVQQGNLQMMDLLLDLGADPHCMNAQGFSPFYMAVEHNSPAVERFLERGVEPDENQTPRSGGYLFCSAQSGCLPVLSMLLDQGSDVDRVSFAGAVALHYAVYGGRAEAVQILIEQGADVNIPNRRQWTALHQAVRIGSSELVRLLVENGADLEAKDKDGRTPLLAASQTGQLDAVRDLLHLGADIEAEDNEHQSAQNLARANHHTDVSAFIAERKNELKMRGKQTQPLF